MGVEWGSVIKGDFEEDDLDEDRDNGLEEERNLEAGLHPVKAAEDRGDEHD